jgi:hypothetical protein
MKKGSKKHTVTPLATPSIDKLPKSNSILTDAIRDAKQVYKENKSINTEKIRSDVYSSTDETHQLWNKQGHMISSDEHKKLLESTPEEPEHNYNKLDDDFNKKLNNISQSYGGNAMSDYTPTNPNDDIYKNFHENMKTYPSYISVEGATLLNVAFATEQPVFLSKLPAADIEIINKQLDKLNNPNIIREHSIVKMDSTKDFELWFLTKKSSKLENAPITKQKLDDQINGLSCGKSTNRSISSDEIDDMITELEDDCDGVIDRKDETVKIRLFNTVIHPEPINTIGVPIELDGTILGDTMRPNVNVHNGILTINNQQTRFKYLAGISSKEELETSIMNESVKPQHQYKAELPVATEECGKPVIIKNRNAFEIRLSVLENAIHWSSLEETKGQYKKPSDDELLSLARKFYDFVENKNK